MQANIIPGTTRLTSTQGQQQLVITDIHKFYRYAAATIDLVNQRRIWSERQKR